MFTYFAKYLYSSLMLRYHYLQQQEKIHVKLQLTPEGSLDLYPLYIKVRLNKSNEHGKTIFLVKCLFLF